MNRANLQLYIFLISFGLFHAYNYSENLSSFSQERARQSDFISFQANHEKNSKSPSFTDKTCSTTANLQEKFSNAFKYNLWNDPESKSGPGSTINYTLEFRKVLSAILRGLDCQSILDAPCGDFNWMSLVDLTGIAYIGGDIAPEMIAEIAEKYPNVDFRYVDITSTVLPSVDFWLCRDVLFHLSNEDIKKTIKNFKKSDIKYFATSHFFGDTNVDVTSDPTTYRPVNLTKPPFNLPQPDYILKDWVPGFPERWLAIWNKDRLTSVEILD